MNRTVKDRLLSHVHISTETGCWEWTGYRNRQGYGRVTVPGRSCLAHRVSYEEHRGSIPDGLIIDHLCSNPPCINPDHLEAVSQRENLLRGATFQSRNAAKTHCVNGHEFTPENTYITHSRGGVCRQCKSCTRAAERRYREKKSTW